MMPAMVFVTLARRGITKFFCAAAKPVTKLLLLLGRLSDMTTIATLTP